MRSRQILTFISALLLAGLVADCDKEEPEIIDPCPGWPCFKVGNEWTYEDVGWLVQDVIWTADTIVKIEGRYYLRIKEYQSYARAYLDTIFIRTDGDSIFEYCEGIYERYDENGMISLRFPMKGEFLDWIFEAPINTYWWTICTREDGTIDTITKIVVDKNEDFCFEIAGDTTCCNSTVHLAYSLFKNGEPKPNEVPCYTYICKEYGLVYLYIFGDYMILKDVNFKTTILNNGKE
jgi:hypothetical protein